VEEVLAYVRRKLELARDFPRESRLFRQRGAAAGRRTCARWLGGELAALVGGEGRGARKGVDWQRGPDRAGCRPRHLVFSIWALSSITPDFEAQVRRRAWARGATPSPRLGPFLDALIRRSSRPDAGTPAARALQRPRPRGMPAEGAGPGWRSATATDPRRRPGGDVQGEAHDGRVAGRGAVPDLPLPASTTQGSLWKLTWARSA
jgi:hypothetical protein